MRYLRTRHNDTSKMTSNDCSAVMAHRHKRSDRVCAALYPNRQRTWGRVPNPPSRATSIKCSIVLLVVSLASPCNRRIALINPGSG